MKKGIIILFATVVILLFGVQCTFLEQQFNRTFKKETYILDLEGIKNRGFIRAAVDNNSTGYYIYRGRRMGYEYELLRDLAKRLGVQLNLVLVSDIDKAFEYLNDGRVDLIAMNLEKSPVREGKATFTQALGKISTVLVSSETTPATKSWQDLESDTIFVRQGAVYKSQLCKIKDSLQVSFTVIESPLHEETLIDQV
ncbi:MAG TPA: lytic transglycosylase F, partial [Algoriphagus sp.]|nr:lytic transglycosylase F [Algoriphagus sp.]